MKTPVTSGKLKHHFAYNWWKYVLIAALAIGVVDLLYTVTAYRSPRDKTIGLYVYGYINEQPLTDYMENVRATEMPDMEEMMPQMLIAGDNYGQELLMTRLAAGEGDLYLLPREQFLSFAESGALIPLETDSELLAMFDSAGISLQRGWRRETETGETHLYGIPQDKLPGLGQYIYTQDGFLCLNISGKNQENASRFLHILCRDMINPPQETESASVQ